MFFGYDRRHSVTMMLIDLRLTYFVYEST